MAAIENEKIFGLKIRESANDGSDFSNPDADYRLAFIGEDGEWHFKDSAGTVTDPGGGGSGPEELDYTEFTSPVTISATVEASADTVVSAGAVVFDGSTVVEIEFYAPYMVPPDQAAGNSITLYLFDGSTSIGRIALLTTVAAANQFAPVHTKRRLTPSAASHTYSVRGLSSTGSDTGSVGAGVGGVGAYVPGFIRIVTIP